jgi:hypothetical protein
LQRVRNRLAAYDRWLLKAGNHFGQIRLYFATGGLLLRIVGLFLKLRPSITSLELEFLVLLSAIEEEEDDFLFKVL